ncbi:MAG: hypothetical protein R2719_04120 [Micropruina sp.]
MPELFGDHQRGMVFGQHHAAAPSRMVEVCAATCPIATAVADEAMLGIQVLAYQIRR